MYDFDNVINRRNTNSFKWDVPEGELPMWVADMDFETAPEIKEAIQKRASHGVYGYTIVPEEWFNAYVRWWKVRYDFEIKPEWLTFCTGVIPAISSIVRKLTTPNENVLIMTPVYNIFFNSIVNNGARVLECPLKLTGLRYDIDFDDLETKLRNPQTTLMLLCNPQNPTGRIWSREELQRIGDLCEKYNVTVVADEIHCDLTDPGKEYIPFASVSDVCRDISVTCIAPTKTFNIAGLQTAAIYSANRNLHHKVYRALNTDEVAEPNVFAIEAAIAAYTRGDAWLDKLREYIHSNKEKVYEYVSKNIPQIRVIPAEATYLLWLYTGDVTDDSSALQQYLKRKAGLYLSEGNIYGSDGRSFLRMNVACPKTVLEEGLKRLKDGIENYLSETGAKA